MLTLFRTIEFEIPKLSAFRQAYTPPTSKQYLNFRFQHYQGENHPASRKVVLTVNTADLKKAGAVKDDKSPSQACFVAGSRFHPKLLERAVRKGK